MTERYDYFSYNGEPWTSIYLEYGYDAEAWMLRGFVSTSPSGRSVALGHVDLSVGLKKGYYTEYSGSTPTGNGMIAADPNHEYTKFNEITREFLGYNVYLDGGAPVFVTDEFYQYTGLVNGTTYLAEVTADYDEGESVPIDFTFIYNSVTTFDPPSNVAIDDVAGTLSWSAPIVGGVIYSDDLESYTVGEYLAVQSADWTTWSNAPGSGEDALISDVQALSGSNSVVVEGTSDLVLIMDNYTTGVYSMELNLFVPTGYCGYWNLQKTNTIGQEWAFQIMFDVTGIASADAGAVAALTFPFSFDTWINMELVIDLDADWCDIYVDGALMFGYQWTLGCFGTPGLLSLGGLNLYAWASAGNSPQCYFDDIVFSEVSSDTRDLTGYNVYLDDMGTILETVGIDVFEYTYTGLVYGVDYVAGVSAVYDDGVSVIVEVPFTFNGTEGDEIVIVATKLHGNYPNPFNPVTNIAYSIKTAGKVTLEVYNIKGQLVKTLVNEVMETGDHTAIWNGKDNTGKSVSSGVYFYKMKAGNYTATNKMILMK